MPCRRFFCLFFKHFGLAVSACLSLLLQSCDRNQEKQEYKLNERISDTELHQLQIHKSQNPDRQDHVFYFGFDLRSSPQEDARQYLPFLKYLESQTGYRFKLFFTPKTSNIIEELGSNRVQFAAIGAISFLAANARYRAIPLTRGINLQGNAQYQSILVVGPNSRIKTVADLKGKRLAFGDRTSTQGHLIPRIILSKHNIELSDLAKYHYTGSHRNCANAVISGKFDACAMQDTMAKTLAMEGKLKILHASKFYPSSGIAANATLPEDVIKRVKKALLDFEPNGKHRTGLYHWDQTEMPNGFIEARLEDYDELNHWSIELGFLEQ